MIFDRRGVYLDEEDLQQEIQFDKNEFDALKKDLKEEFGIEDYKLIKHENGKKYH